MGTPKGKRYGGRQKGTPNKISSDMRASILNVYAMLGGDAAYLEWARGNPTEYYKIASKLIPKDINLNDARRLEDIVGGSDDPNDGDQT